jgi:hypothetical protein
MKRLPIASRRFIRISIAAFKFRYTSCIICDTELNNCLNLNLKCLSASAHPRSDSGNRNTAFQPVSHNRADQHTNNSGNSNPPRRILAPASNNVVSNPRSSHTENFNQNMLLNNSNNENNPIVCYCGTTAASKTVRKDGPNQGTEFYMCAL